MRVPAKIHGEDSEDEPKTKEITEEESDEGLIVDSFIVSASSNPKKSKIVPFEKSSLLKELAKSRKYLEIVDFDDHFNEDIALDWTNPGFD